MSGEITRNFLLCLCWFCNK